MRDLELFEDAGGVEAGKGAADLHSGRNGLLLFFFDQGYVKTRVDVIGV